MPRDEIEGSICQLAVCSVKLPEICSHPFFVLLRLVGAREHDVHTLLEFRDRQRFSSLLRPFLQVPLHTAGVGFTSGGAAIMGAVTAKMESINESLFISISSSLGQRPRHSPRTSPLKACRRRVQPRDEKLFRI